ncbi:MAG: SBBP repeat-containing protein [Terriglobales bacterium]
MKRACFVCLFLCLTTSFLLSQSNPVPSINQTAKVASPGIVSSINASQANPKAQARILDGYGKLPLSFEANRGQTDARVKFLSRTGGYTLFLTGDEAVLTLRGKKKSLPQGLKPASLAASGGTAEAMPFPKTIHGTSSSKNDTAADRVTGAVLRMKLRHVNPAAKVTGADELAGTSNYFIGNDPAKWRANVPTYAKVKYEGIYPGVDLVYYGNQRQLEYDFIVAPGADPRHIQFDVRGAKRIRRDARGDLVLKMGEGEIRWHKPVVYQEKNGTRQLVAAHYAITDKSRVGFEVAKYDAGRPLYIDPLIYSTYLGGSNYDYGQSIAVDSTGNAYVTGYTGSTDFPTTPGAFQTTCCGAFVTKLNPTGSALVYSTYLGGSSSDGALGIAVDSAGNAYVTGDAYSTDFPVTPGAFQTNFGGGESDTFVTEINPTGSALVYSTYLGGSSYEYGYGIAVDSAGSAYVSGFTWSADFPTTPGAFQTNFGSGGGDAFVTKLNSTGSALVYSTYLGGSGNDDGSGIAVDSAGNAYVTGATGSTDFPTTPGAFQTTCNGGNYCAKYGDAFVSKLNPTGSALVYSTYLGGNSYEYGAGIAVDSAGNAYVTGGTYSRDFPTMNPLQATFGGGQNDAFVSKLNPTGAALIYSTYLGGKQSDYGDGIAVDSAGNVYVTGVTWSGNFPLADPFKKNNGGYSSAFVSRFNPAGSALISSTFLGGSREDRGYGIAVDSTGKAYVTGFTLSTNFPVTPGAFQTNLRGGGGAFVTKIPMLAATTTALTSSPNPSTYGQPVAFTATVASRLGAPPDGETVTFMKGKTVLGTGSLSGGSASFTTSTLKVGTNLVRAAYGGDSNFAGSTSPALSQVVNKAATTTTLVSSQNPSNFEQAVTFTASVAPQFSGTPTGTVTFYDDTTALKTVKLSGGVAKFTTATLASGTHTITATHNGSTSFSGSSASLTQTVN